MTYAATGVYLILDHLEREMKYGRYEIKKVQENKALSEETTNFDLDLYVDGKKFAAVSNAGRGGSNRVHPYPPFSYLDIARVEAEMATDDFLVDSDVEMFDCAITTLLSMRDATKDIARLTKSKAAFILDDEINTLGYKGGKKAPDQALFDHVAREYPAAVILNTMDAEEAIITLVKHTRAVVEAEYAKSDEPPAPGV